MRSLCVFSSALLMFGLAHAQSMDTPNSDYGFTPPGFTTSKSCFTLDADGNLANLVSCPGGDVMAENFHEPTIGGLQIFDFEITNLSNFTITLTGSSNSSGGYGGFVCDNGAATPASSPQPGMNGIGIQCFGNLNFRDPTQDILMTNVDSFTNVPNTNVASFHVRGSGNGYVFFMAVPLGSIVSAKITFDSTVEVFAARLLGDSEVPPINSAGTATFHVEIGTTNAFTLTFSGLSSNLIFSHLHFAPTKVGGGIMIFLCGGGNQPACPAATSGSISGTITGANVTGPATQGIAAGDLTSALEAVREGNAYANMHTQMFPAGEIRGQVRRGDRREKERRER